MLQRRLPAHHVVALPGGEPPGSEDGPRQHLQVTLAIALALALTLALAIAIGLTLTLTLT